MLTKRMFAVATLSFNRTRRLQFTVFVMTFMFLKVLLWRLVPCLQASLFVCVAALEHNNGSDTMLADARALHARVVHYIGVSEQGRHWDGFR